eukprot:364334_1
MDTRDKHDFEDDVMKEEEETKVMHNDHIVNMDQIDEKVLQIGNFVSYTDCDKDTIHCTAVNRLLLLLAYYKKIQSTVISEATVTMYEYMTSLNNNYKLSDVMEDWYHFKKAHTLNKNNITHFENCQEINCVNTQYCMYLNRYQRDRCREIYKLNEEVDCNNIILMDQMDSIHAYIFHAIPSRLSAALQNQYIMSTVNDNNVANDATEDQWSNKPQSVADCTVSQIIIIVNHIITDVNKLQKLLPDIIEYIRQNELNGQKITNTSRKHFMKDAAAHFDNKKLTIQFGKLYSAITKYDVSKFMRHNNNSPKYLSECTVDEIVAILNDYILDNLDSTDLKAQKCNVFEFIKAYKFDGEQIMNRRKEFILKLKEYLNDPKLSGQIAKLHKQIINYQFSSRDEILQRQKSAVEQLKPNNKFVSSNTNSKNYSFGTQYRYTPNLSYHPLYIQPKFTSLKEEVIEYFTEINRQNDANTLLCAQLTNMDKIENVLQPLSFELITNQIHQNSKDIVCGFLKNLYYEKNIPDNVYNVVLFYYYDIQNSAKILWNDQHKKEEKTELFQIIEIESENCTKIRRRMKDFKLHIFHYLPTDFHFYSNCTLIILLDLFFDQKCCAIRESLRQYFQSIDYVKLVQQLKIMLEGAQDKLLRIITNVYKNTIELEPYLNIHKSKSIPWSPRIRTRLQEVFAQEEKRQTVDTKIIRCLVDAFYLISEFNKNVFYRVTIRQKCDKSLRATAENWVHRRAVCSGTKQWHVLSTADKIRQLKSIFKIDSVHDLQILYQQVKSLFINQVTTILQRTVQQNKISYIELTNSKRFEPYVHKANIKCRTNSVKRLKAFWYHGMNDDHGIPVGDTMNTNHVIALTCYSHCAELCTAFRETYRSKHQNETMAEQKKRHAAYSYMGKLLYQSFVFFASRDCQVQILYHGMSVQLSFPTLYCVFDAPTSTTTAASVASGFCNDQGIVAKFESCDSLKNIRSLDMSLFTCFDNEEEHLIFETRLHIKDIFIPSENVWIGKKWMNKLSLYDLLIHANDIYDECLLKKKNQKNLCKTLKHIMNDDAYSVSPSVYLNSLINTIVFQNKKIWLNAAQLRKLSYHDLQTLFLDDNNQFGELIQYLRDKCSVKVCPIFMSKWIMSDGTFDLIERVTKKYDNLRIYGSLVTFVTPNKKRISFRPQLTMVHDLFDIQMQLIDTSDVEQIRIHFNVACKQLNGFYTSLHPRWMNIDHYNAWDITLPQRNIKSMDTNTISLEMSVMLHNFESFGINCNDFVSNLEPITQEIVQIKKSYKCADILSLVYGMS